jgi:hypothetical protein
VLEGHQAKEIKEARDSTIPKDSGKQLPIDLYYKKIDQ